MLSDTGFDFGWSQGLDLILVDPFKLRILDDFKIVGPFVASFIKSSMSLNSIFYVNIAVESFQNVNNRKYLRSSMLEGLYVTAAFAEIASISRRCK